MPDYPKPLTDEDSKDVVKRLQYAIDHIKLHSCQCDLDVGFTCETCSELSLLSAAKIEIVTLRMEVSPLPEVEGFEGHYFGQGLTRATMKGATKFGVFSPTDEKGWEIMDLTKATHPVGFSGLFYARYTKKK